jgi:acetylornithine deacetylase/succinyl-diaminopimelate desuccinylase-like protein
MLTETVMPPAVADYLQRHRDRFLEELKALLRIPSVSADPAYLPAMRQAAEFVRDQFQSMGLTTEIVPTAGHPIVYAEWLGQPGAPTVLVYGHYDVQPPDPLDLWTTPPFEPTIRDGKIYARGATDDKGQFFTHLKAAEAWLKSTGGLPVNLKFVIEGEEEVGGANLDRFLAENKQKLKCDVAVISDGSQYAPGIPAINYGLRGIIACEVTLTGPKRDLHSGIFGGSVTNPINALCRLIAQLHDEHGRVQIPGFYDDVLPLTDAERKQFAALPFDEAAYQQELGVPVVHGEEGFTTLERRWVRPTCDVNGITGGYQGVGPKTIIPSKASAKITCRLVPNQDPRQVTQSLEQFLRKRCPKGTALQFTDYHGCRAFLFDPTSPYIHAAQVALRAGFGRDGVLIRDGGSIPVVVTLEETLGVETLLLGWGLNTDALHSPDEHFTVEDFHRGCSSAAALLESLSKKSGQSGRVCHADFVG